MAAAPAAPPAAPPPVGATPLGHGYPAPHVIYYQPPPKRDDRTIIIIVIVVVVLVVAIPIALSAVLYFMVGGLVGNPPPPNNIGMACVKANTTSFRCEIAAADPGVDFAAVDVLVLDPSGNVIGEWKSPIRFPGPVGALPVSAPRDPLDPSSRLADNGDGLFGIGDSVHLSPVSGSALAGCTLRIIGPGGIGSFTIG